MKIKTYQAPLLLKRKETHDTMTFRFGINMDFRPGQFVMLNAGGRSEAFSVCSPPMDKGYIEISMKMTGSAYKKALDDAKTGDKFEIKGPYGHFLLDGSKGAIMIAGGIGITPFMSMISYATAKKLPTKITLLYSNKTPEDIAFRKEFDELQKQNKNLGVIHTITRPEGHEWSGRTGRVDEEMIKSVPYWKGALFYVCGPGEMVDSMTALLQGMGITKERIKAERFGGY